MKQRIFKLDLVRVVALLLIISNHALNTVWNANDYAYFNAASLFEQGFMLFGYITCRLGVPLFLMISGALILNKKFETGEDIKKFYKDNLLKLIIAVVSWNILYYVFSLFYSDASFSIRELIYIIFFMKNSTMPHMWYMPMIIGMYTILPFVAVIVKKFNFKNLLLPIILSVGAFYLLPNLKTFLNFTGHPALYIRTILDVSALGGTYLIYILLGYYIYNDKLLRKIKTSYLLIVIILLLAGTGVFQVFGYAHNNTYIIYYNFTGILFSSIILFELLLRLKEAKNNRLNKFIELFSKMSLGIYFVHRPLLFFFKKFWVLTFHPTLNVIIYYIVSIIISWIVVYVMSKISLMKKYLLIMKD